MFIDFFYKLKSAGIPVSPTSFLRLHKALRMGLIATLDDLYCGGRSILVKNEKHFDCYDQVFAHVFEGAALYIPDDDELSETARLLLDEWLRDPEAAARALGTDRETVQAMSREELTDRFLKLLREQTEEHHGGNRWIGTRGRSPFGHSGIHDGGMRIGGESRNHSAIATALERRYRDYSREGPMSASQMGEALKRLRNMVPVGPRDCLNVDKTINETLRRAGEVEIVFDRSLRDRLNIILAIDNGGWSMEPYIDLVRTLFQYARAQFRELRTLYFHNAIYGCLWEDPQRLLRAVPLEELLRLDPRTRFLIVGDGNMAPSELTAVNGSIRFGERSGIPGVERLRSIAQGFPHAIWINPIPARHWDYSRSITIIREILPMFELTLDGLEKAVAWSMRKA